MLEKEESEQIPVKNANIIAKVKEFISNSGQDIVFTDTPSWYRKWSIEEGKNVRRYEQVYPGYDGEVYITEKFLEELINLMEEELS